MLVHGEICQLYQRCRVFTVIGVNGYPYCCTQTDIIAVNVLDIRQTASHGLTHRDSGLFIGVGQHHNEFVTAPTPYTLAIAKLTQLFGGLLQCSVTDFMTKTVVNLFKPIQVNEENGQLATTL